MARLPRAVVALGARTLAKTSMAMPPRLERPAVEALGAIFGLIGKAPDGISASRQARGGVPGELVAPDDQAGPARILYLHGGGYEAGSPRTHRPLVSALAAAAEEAAFACDYRLAPEHPAPAALADALAAYRAMAAEAGGGVALAGDSAGGGLALATAVAAREQGLAPPIALALISPWVDLTMSGSSYRENRWRDALLPLRAVARGARSYAAELGAQDPVCSPLRADLSGLPPTLIHAGGNELLLSDSRELARRLGDAGVEVELRVFAGLWHVFHLQAGMLREADEAIAELGSWLSLRLAA